MFDWKKEYKNFIWMTIGSFFFVIGVNMFLTPANVYALGVMGFSQEISTLLSVIFNTPDLTGIIYFIINIPPIILGWFKVGKRFTLRTFYVVAIISIFSAIIPTNIVLVTDPLLATITSGILMGIGLGFTLRVGSSTGGTDIVVLYMSLVKGKSFGIYNIILNAIVIIGAVIITQDVTVGVLMFILLYILGIAVDKVHQANEKVTIFIVTTKPEPVKRSIYSSIKRGLTLIDSEGGLTGQKGKMIFITVSRGEIYQVIESVKLEDKRAWINIVPVENVVGYFPSSYKNIL